MRCAVDLWVGVRHDDARLGYEILPNARDMIAPGRGFSGNWSRLLGGFELREVSLAAIPIVWSTPHRGDDVGHQVLALAV